MEIFYAPNLKQHPQLPEEEAYHCIRVLRHQAGDRLRITDGLGTFYDAELLLADPKHCTLAILQEYVQPVKKPSLHLAVALTKQTERWEWMLEKITELGVAGITPLLSQRTERKRIHPERLQKIMIAAMKQSQQCWLPVLHPLCSFTDFIHQQEGQPLYLAQVDPANRLNLREAYSGGQPAVMMIGPEGDFTPEEVTLATAFRAKRISLGETVLRTETAAIAACAQLVFMNLKNAAGA